MIFFVLCPAFHGATLLSLLLNNHSRVLSLGDTNPTREYDQICSCGKAMTACDFWIHIAQAVNCPNEAPYPTLMRTRPDLPDIASLGFSLGSRILGAGVWKLAGSRATGFQQEYSAFLKACQDWAAHDVFIDGEKSLMKFCIAASMGFPVGGVIHITRDPRAYVASCLKYGAFESAEKAAQDWLSYHKRIDFFARYFAGKRVFHVRYEDIARWQSWDRGPLLSFLGVEEEGPLNTAPKDLRKHHLMGNKMLASFDGTVSLDELWKTSLSDVQKQEILSITHSVFSKFGYEA